MSNPSASGLPTPHEGQQQVLEMPGRYKVAICGRRFGKTVAAALAAIRTCEARPNQRVWWISPIQDQSDRVERDVTFWLKERTVSSRSKRKKSDDIESELNEAAAVLQWTHRTSEHALVCDNGSRMEFHSAHTPDRLRGAGLDLAIIDEAADVSEYTWKEVVKPMLLESRGKAFVVGTPRGKNNWLHRIFMLGNNQESRGPYSSIQLPTTANPLIPAADLEEYKLDMTPEKYRQEFEAEFIDGVDTVFAGIDSCIFGPRLTVGRPGVKYVTGIDLGQSVDYTVLCSIACSDKKVEGFARFNQLDWSIQEKQICEHLKHFPGPALVDATGNGRRVYEMLRDTHRGHVEPFVFTAQTRSEILTGLQLGFSYKKLSIPNEQVLLDELHAFTWVNEGPADSVRRRRMCAPSGTHDDCVMALALAWWALEKRALWAIGSGGNPLQEHGVFG
ncbi:MAG: phage terminase large subunit [Planctomycetota bacterium]